MMDLILVLIVSAVVGLLIGKMRQLEMPLSLIVGAAGGLLGHFVFPIMKLPLGTGITGIVISSVLGATFLVFLFSFFKKTA